MTKIVRTPRVKPKIARPDVEVKSNEPDQAEVVKATRLRAGEVSVVDSHAPKLVPR